MPRRAYGAGSRYPEEPAVSDKSPKKDSAKKEGKSLKEKRSAKKIKAADKASKNA